MAHPGSDGRTGRIRSERLRWTARNLKRTGVALVLTALPALVVTGAVGAVEEAASPFPWIVVALATPITSPGGVAWAFHVAALTVFVGVWILGLALVIEGVVAVE